MFFEKFLLKWGKNEGKCWVQHILFLNGGLYIFFSNGHIHNVVSTLPNVVQFNVEKHNVVSTLFCVVNFNVDIRNIISTLIWRCTMSRHHINLRKTLNRRWNVCWEVKYREFLSQIMRRSSFKFHQVFKSRFYWRGKPSNKVNTVEEEQDGIDVDGIGNLMDLPKQMFIDEECGNLKVVFDDG